MKILIVANKSKWKSYTGKIADVVEWYWPKIKLDVEIEYTNFEDIPFVPFVSNDPAQNALPVLEGVQDAWYDANVLPLAFQHNADIVLLQLNMTQWPYKDNARGWRTDHESGVIELQIGCDENEYIQWPNFPSLGSFFQLARHEIMHAMFMITGQPDTTHYWWNLGNLEAARDSLVFNNPNWKIPFLYDALAYCLKLITGIKAQLPASPLLTPVPGSMAERIFEAAYGELGVDASPYDAAPDDLACAESVTTILHAVIPGFPILTGTAELKKKLKTFSNWERVAAPQPGCIVLSATGDGHNIDMPHGHTGIASKNGKIMSNTSFGPNKGKWMENYDLQTWRDRFVLQGKYPMEFWNRKG